jgi:hypothetical protein
MRRREFITLFLQGRFTYRDAATCAARRNTRAAFVERNKSLVTQRDGDGAAVDKVTQGVRCRSEMCSRPSAPRHIVHCQIRPSRSWWFTSSTYPILIG